MFQVLVVEDDQELNRTVCAYLNQNGYQALGCLNANEAYDAMYGGTLFDLIISDIMMPGVDGFAFAKTVRELNQEIPILFMTARDDFASKQRGFQAGIDDYMVKPIDLDELLLRMDADDEKAHHPGQQHAAQHGRPQRQQHLAQREPLSS
mgnify:CR=1 FL=1